MLVKVVQHNKGLSGDSTSMYEVDSFFLSHNFETKNVTLYIDGKCRNELMEGDEVYVMNNEGKTIDHYVV